MRHREEISGEKVVREREERGRNQRLDDGSLVADPVTGPLFVLCQRPTPEAAYVGLQHGGLLLVCHIQLQLSVGEWEYNFHEPLLSTRLEEEEDFEQHTRPSPFLLSLEEYGMLHTCTTEKSGST